MKRKSDRPLTKHTISLFEGQLEKLQALHPRPGATPVIRALIDNHIRAVEDGAQQRFAPLPESPVKIEEIL